jgi:hypothetical protein
MRKNIQLGVQNFDALQNKTCFSQSFLPEKGGLNGCEAFCHLRARRYTMSVNKVRSVVRCQLNFKGEFTGNMI